MSELTIPVRIYAEVSGNLIEIARADVPARITLEPQEDGAFRAHFDLEGFMADLGAIVELDHSHKGDEATPGG